MIPVFANPQFDVVFKKIFGRKERKNLLIQLLNALLELSSEDMIVDLELLSPEQQPLIEGMKYSIVDVKCLDQKGRTYLVEMQILPAEGFEQRVVYNVAKSYVMQLRQAEKYPALSPVVGVTICNFKLFDESVPMLSRWKMQEQHSQKTGLDQLQYVFLELPKYAGGEAPHSLVEKWAYFFKRAGELREVPAVLGEEPYREALEVARVAKLTEGEYLEYEREQMADRDQRGIIDYAHNTGREEGLQEGLRAGILDLCEAHSIPVSPSQMKELASMNAEALKVHRAWIKNNRTWPSS